MTSGIDVFDCDLATGTLGDQRRLVEFPGEFVDRICVDDEGCIWSAIAFTGTQRRYSQSGEVTAVVSARCTTGPAAPSAARTAVIRSSQPPPRSAGSFE
jgi:sugar lactone lactonase YvrE